MVDVSVSAAASWFCKNLVLWIIKLYALTQIEQIWINKKLVKSLCCKIGNICWFLFIRNDKIETGAKNWRAEENILITLIWRQSEMIILPVHNMCALLTENSKAILKAELKKDINEQVNSEKHMIALYKFNSINSITSWPGSGQSVQLVPYCKEWWHLLRKKSH